MIDSRSVLKRILDAADLSVEACASALGLSKHVFGEMLAGQREIPDSLVPLISAVMGVQEAVLTSPAREGRASDVVPAIWYKLRGSGLQQADRSYVLTIRQLAFYQHELEQVTDTKAVGWSSLFAELRNHIDPQAPPAEQGRRAARLFRASTGLDKGAKGIGEVFRGHLRNIGILVIETSAADSVLEGCSFYVGPTGSERPALFANSYKTTWFRRNRILMHELAHAIFDVHSASAALDISGGQPGDFVQEQRADAFAQEVLVPVEVLRHAGAQRGIEWNSLDTPSLVSLMADTHVEQRLVTKALSDCGFIEPSRVNRLNDVDLAQELRAASPHAMTTEEYVRQVQAEPWFKQRTTTTAPTKLLLPFRYVGAVLEAMRSFQISRGKAARMLMIDEYELAERFGTELLAYAE